MASPLRIVGGTGALRSGGAMQVTLNPRDVARVHKRFDQNRDAPLRRRLSIASLKAADLMVGPIRSASPSRTGRLRRSVRARQGRTGGFSSTPTLSALVGPTAPHGYLVIHGHRVVSHSGRDLGFSTRANPFVARAARLKGRAIDTVRRAAFV